MQITVRIPTVQYGYQEITVNSIAEYNEQVPLFVQAYQDMKAKLKQPELTNEDLITIQEEYGV